ASQLAVCRVFEDGLANLLNSCYVPAGPRHARARRGLITRPDLQHVAAYRAHVDDAVEQLLADADDTQLLDVTRILEIGLHHEQQHQELLVTDVLHAFAQNPIAPIYDSHWRPPPAQTQSRDFVDLPPGLHIIGFDGEGYSFDNEGPAHQVYLRPVRIARSLLTNPQCPHFLPHHPPSP